MEHMYLISDLSRRLDVPPHRIAYLYTTRRLPEPLRVGNRRLFNEADARRVAEALGLSWGVDQHQGAHG